MGYEEERRAILEERRAAAAAQVEDHFWAVWLPIMEKQFDQGRWHPGWSGSTKAARTRWIRAGRNFTEPPPTRRPRRKQEPTPEAGPDGLHRAEPDDAVVDAVLASATPSEADPVLVDGRPDAAAGVPTSLRAVALAEVMHCLWEIIPAVAQTGGTILIETDGATVAMVPANKWLATSCAASALFDPGASQDLREALEARHLNTRPARSAPNGAAPALKRRRRRPGDRPAAPQ